MAKNPAPSKSKSAARSPDAVVQIGIDTKDRAAIADGLSKLLADTYTLYLTTHNFHWNVTGPMFNTLHQMFMTQYTELWNAVDPIAERIRALGRAAPGSYAQFGSLASIPDAPVRPPKALDMVALLVTGHEAVACTARGVFPIAEAANDQPTADLLTQRLDIHEKTAWMLRSRPCSRTEFRAASAIRAMDVCENRRAASATAALRKPAFLRKSP